MGFLADGAFSSGRHFVVHPLRRLPNVVVAHGYSRHRPVDGAGVCFTDHPVCASRLRRPAHQHSRNGDIECETVIASARNTILDPRLDAALLGRSRVGARR